MTESMIDKMMEDVDKAINTSPIVMPKIITLPNMSVQAKHHRKKRIDKKWFKRYGTVPHNGAIILGNYLLMRPETYERIKMMDDIKNLEKVGS